MKTAQAIKDHAEEAKLFNHRAFVGLAVCYIALLILLARLFYLQIYQHGRYSLLAENNRVNVAPIAPNRGLIFDRAGKLLAENIPAFSLEIIPEQVRDYKQTIDNLSHIISITNDDKAFFYRQLHNKRRFDGVPIRLQLSESELAEFAVNRHQLPGIDMIAGLIRHYPYASETAHLLGYVARINEQELKRLDATNYSATQFIGKVGVEKFYEPILHGKVGHQQIEMDVRGRLVRVLKRHPPIPGANLHLTVDIQLQQAANAALAGKRGAIVVLSTKDGGILALASNPSYDPNAFVVGIDNQSFSTLQHSPLRPLFNRAIRGQYPPGSTIKPLFALAGLKAGVTHAKQRFFDPGWYQLNNDDHKYRNWRREGQGWMTLTGAISQSCSTYFYDLANKLGIRPMAHIMTAFGLGQKTHIDIASEQSGLVPSPEWKRKRYHQAWFPGETLITGIGQGFTLVTPLQLAKITATIANHGRVVQPHIVDYLEYPDGHRQTGLSVRKITAPKPIEGIAEKHWQTIVESMRQVTRSRHGTAYYAFHTASYQTAGKTGTAQVSGIAQGERYNESKTEKHLRDNSLYIGFAPITTPEIAVAVVIENERHGAFLARKVMDSYFKQLHHHTKHHQ